MVFFCWARPSPQHQKACIDKAGTFNYDENFKGATSKPISSLKEDKQLKEAGFALNHARVLVGSGMETFEKGKAALQTWRHFQFNWTFVDSATPIKTGVKFCVCVNEFLPWLMMPLQIAYVDEDKSTKKVKASFSYGSGTLQGHLLAGEERFSLELDKNNQAKMFYKGVYEGSVETLFCLMTSEYMSLPDDACSFCLRSAHPSCDLG